DPRRLSLPQGAPVRAPPERHGAPGRLRASGVIERSLRWQLELARTRVVSRELSPHRVAAEALLLLRRQPQGRVPDRFRSTAGSLAGGDRALAAAHPDLPARPGRTPAGLRRDGEVPARPPLAGSGPLLRVLPR